ncbi:DUF1624 domain-containing protein [Pseudoduganella aquatica]|uniref:DUF1624 domain-containing protein n=1 Tax=Pseudoduganella aquatica TaxID=2660641 RepID=A0A7X4HH40_9BURK|nr:heparan-alpha-glucosaminide N-acetyltransferase domain-containing protein [Pseudoduganella aquatica]MYN10643.1 DUF1624 domain-containing protein [Pseudoduganella aquatica]
MTANNSSARVASIDIVRGIIMLLMTVDHVRETFYLSHQVSDPMDAASTPPALFFTRLAAHFCAPLFVFLTGLAAWLYAHPPGGPRSATGFLLKRGALLLFLELVVINFAWSGQWPGPVLYLQVMWAIGLSMIALALLHRLPLPWLAALGALIVAGHNTLPTLAQLAASFGAGFEPGGAGHMLWTVLEQRGYLASDGAVKVRISYPLLAWIGVILLGYAAGPLYSRTMAPQRRVRVLLAAGAAAPALLLVLRTFNIYGEALPWAQGTDTLHSAMSFLNFTKYPPSLDFLLLTLGAGMLVLAWLEPQPRAIPAPAAAWRRACAVFGGAPLFYYLLHLYALLALQRIASALQGTGSGRYEFNAVWQLWLASALLAALLYLPTRWFGRYKRSSGNAWLKYF